jgi:sulfate/thiosulfate transport system substrate-binding protein
MIHKTLRILSIIAMSLALPAHAADTVELLNVSYDPTREFYEEYNPLFITHYKEQTGVDVVVKQSHGGSSKQARAVMEGLRGDVVTLALAYDIDMIAKLGKRLDTQWQQEFPHQSAPCTSTIVFLVRKGNPKNIQDWNDLVREDVAIITPNPKTSGGARWNYLAAYAYAIEHFAGDEAKTYDYMRTLFKRVMVWDAGARGATTTFAQRRMGDVLITWESEAHLALKEIGEDQLELVIPSFSIQAEPTVAVVDKVVERRGTQKVARAYLDYLYSKPAQRLAAKHYCRPRDAEIMREFAAQFQPTQMKTVADLGGWEAVHAKHFAEGALFDQIMKK